eukprot:gnl/TRDRNA2_/TRDRNA2_173453_c2_seq1.p1 gnl/TRDRNA2_/TRDRNA2_173453_c2~~gnl/TRDRNA2_/TRDRNA2_173453_c2_seq1.p1  ORF type:complete len:602 (+),score=116.03 gnl/TRDRNA2_/TRDRNA2_173453_c2_seq1:55-1806(+)
MGELKVRCALIHPPDNEWVSKIKAKDDLNAVLFDSIKLRKHFKDNTPPMIRVRTYIVRGLNVSGADSGFGNPYLFFQYGHQQVRLPGHHQQETTDPRFYKTEERDIRLPQQSHFQVGLFDFKDGGEGDLLIGSSIIDLEDRWYSNTFQGWMKANQVPMEYRPMETGQAGSLSKGSLELWIEMIDASQVAEIPVNVLQEPPAVELEIRIVIWTCRQVSLRLCRDDEYSDPRERIDMKARCTLDCRSYMGPQPREQDSDVHYSCEGSAEYNWRFVFSRVQMRKGMPLNCFLQISLWEVFAVSRPALMCESLVELKHYCKEVSRNGMAFSIDAELPMRNGKLDQMLAAEKKAAALVNDEGADDDEGAEGPSDEQLNEAHAANLMKELDAKGKGEQSQEMAPAGLVKVQLDILAQGEASSQKVALGRDEPNRAPVLNFPKSGRRWQDTLPTALKVVDAIIEGVEGGKKRCGIVCCIAIILLPIIGCHMMPDKSTGCAMLLQRSCCSDACPCCQSCGCLKMEEQAQFCQYVFASAAACTKMRGCNCGDTCEAKDTCKGPVRRLWLDDASGLDDDEFGLNHSLSRLFIE